tara:strand:- start:935 stop:2095 length:1161 start_codon:yes stop_codon:yes gene_type:complete
VLDSERFPSETEFLSRAQILQTALRSRAEECALRRSVSPDTIQDFKNAQLHRLTQPLSFGGHAKGWDILCGVARRLCRADGSQGWVLAIMADHAQMLGTFPLQAQKDVWGENSEATMAASFDPTGVAVAVKGGFQLSGRFGFASGIDHVDWLICAGFIDKGEQKEGPHFFLVRKSKALVIDDWNTIGLEGTGSKSFELKDVFVPSHAMLDGALARAGEGPGSKVHPQAIYRLPRGFLTPAIFAAMSIGMAEGLMDEWLSYTKLRKSRGVSVGAKPSSHMIAGECGAEIDSANALNEKTITNAIKVIHSQKKLTQVELLAAKRNSAWACRTALKAGTRLFNAAGGRAIFKNGSIERKYRDLLASASHHIVDYEVSVIDSGRSLLTKP